MPLKSLGRICFYAVSISLTGALVSSFQTPPFEHAIARGHSFRSIKRKQSDEIPDQASGPQHHVLDRRKWLATGLIMTGALVAEKEPARAAAEGTRTTMQPSSGLPWIKDPINPKRSSISVFDAERLGYNLSFVTYLTRFLLNFDRNSQQWWISRAKEIPKGANSKDIFKIRSSQFASFAASVEIGLAQEYGGKDGPRQLLQSLLDRFCAPEPKSSKSEDPVAKRVHRETKEARRQIALLFALLGSDSQPTKEITKLLAQIDDGYVSSVMLLDDIAVNGFKPNEEPTVVFPPPQAGPESVQATGRALMEPTGRLLELNILSSGAGYKTANITISPPIAKDGRQAKATAKISQGKLKSVKLVDPGEGYTMDDAVVVSIEPGKTKVTEEATVQAIKEMFVASVEVTNKGTGYAVEKPLRVSLVLPGKEEKEPQRIGYGKTKGEYTSFMASRVSGDNQVRDFEETLEEEGTGLCAATSGGSLPATPFGGKASSSPQLLALLPQGFGLEYDRKLKRYFLSVDTEFREKHPTLAMETAGRSRAMVPDFGPRGKSPIEREMDLDLNTFLRFMLSGALCASGVHLASMPLDVVKTKVQTNPSVYPEIRSSFQTVWKDEGPSTFFAGWLPTVMGNFFAGAILYSTTELIRRSLTEAAGTSATSNEVLIILTAAAIAAAAASIIYCPFEAVRIRTVAQPDYAKNSIEGLSKMISEEGVGSLVNAIPVFLVKQIPYACTKFLVFDLSTDYLYKTFPAAQEDLKLALIVSLIGGVLAGVSAACVSNPADAVISELKKAKSDQTPMQALQTLLDRAGTSALFRGLPIRMVFYSLTAALQFMAYDGVRFALGVGPDDLKLYLDVLGGSLASKGTIA